MPRIYLACGPWIQTMSDELNRIICYQSAETIFVAIQIYRPIGIVGREILTLGKEHYNCEQSSVNCAIARWNSLNKLYMGEYDKLPHLAFILAANAAVLASESRTPNSDPDEETREGEEAYNRMNFNPGAFLRNVPQ